MENESKEPLLTDKDNINAEDLKILKWSDVIERNVSSIAQKAIGYKIMHLQSARKSSQIYTVIMYIAIVVGPVSGLLSSIGAFLHPETAIIWPLSSTIFAFVSGIIVAVVKFAKWEEDTIAHKQSAAKYTSLESNVRRQLAIPRKGRKNASQYTEWVGHSFDELFHASPIIPQGIYNDYVAHANNSGMAIPDEYAVTIQIDKTLEVKVLSRKIEVDSIELNSSQNIHPKSPKLFYNIDPKQTPKSNNKRGFTVTELNQYSDPKMAYEMSRMQGFLPIEINKYKN